MERIALIAPVHSVYEKALKIKKKKNLDNLGLYHGSLEDGLALSKQLENKGVRVIISRGGTYQMIKDAVNIPVIEIKTTTYDLVEAIKDVETMDNVAIVGYPIVISGFKYINNILCKPIKIIEINNKDDISDAIKIARKEGIEIFIGDSTVVEISKKFNCKGILLSSTENSINIAIKEAYNILYTTRALSRKNEELLAMIDNVHDGIIIVNNEMTIININKKAKQVLGSLNNKIIEKDKKYIIESTKLSRVVKTQKPILGKVQNINGNKLLMNMAPIFLENELIGAIATFKPINEVLENEIQIRKEIHKKGFVAKYKFEDIIYASSSMKSCIKKSKIFSKNDAPVYICGETGVGKELISQSIHNESLRRNMPFVAINCAALPPNLIESELFGYEEGAFTGAKKKGKMGVFELAHKGTLFLDEIAELPLDLQGRLLRVIQESEVIRIGGERVINVDVRLITASNKDLLDLVKEGKFREDLYYRIHVLNLKIPALRYRGDDVIVLSNHFLEKFAEKYNKDRLYLDSKTEKVLLNYNFPGNVRELENLMEVATLLGNFEEVCKVIIDSENKTNSNLKKIKTLEELEREYILKIYLKNYKNVKVTAKELGISRTTLWRRIKKIQQNM